MFCDKENVNILTALLAKHGVRHAVVCPGSRNAPIVHNLAECSSISCHAVTDERSAGFYALGLALGEGMPRPVAVCVTSGTALLNLLPAMAEAFYQHVPIVVLSADRPQQWIDQLDGQTLPQADALGRFVRTAVTLPDEPATDEQRWYCNRLVNQALLDMRFPAGAPVHINIPIAEPLFHFTTPQLPDERRIVRRFPYGDDEETTDAVLSRFLEARKPMIVIGQTHADMVFDDDWRSMMEALSERFVVLSERLCNYGIGTVHFDEVLYRAGEDERLRPDVVLHIGGTLVSKRLKQFLRSTPGLQVFRLSREGRLHDTFMHLVELTVCHPEHALRRLALASGQAAADESYHALWQQALQQAADHACVFAPAYSQMAAVKCFEQHLPLPAPRSSLPTPRSSLSAPGSSLPAPRSSTFVHYANSTAIRLANIYAQHAVFCNRGVNGIDGSLSTAAGASLAACPAPTYCIIGDLSFFYDQNALWNRQLGGNFRILLLNNGRGGIFSHLKGLEHSPARDTFVAAEHHTTAEGICRQNGIGYLRATGMEQMEQGIGQLLTETCTRPLLLEVMTDAATDERVYKEYYRTLEINI